MCECGVWCGVCVVCVVCVMCSCCLCYVCVVCVVPGTNLKMELFPKTVFDPTPPLPKSFVLGQTNFTAFFLTIFGPLPHKHGDWVSAAGALKFTCRRRTMWVQFSGDTWELVD